MSSSVSPKITSLARAPLFSTQALVASVVERETRTASRIYSCGSVSSAFAIPTDRSSRVVSVFPFASTRFSL